MESTSVKKVEFDIGNKFLAGIVVCGAISLGFAGILAASHAGDHGHYRHELRASSATAGLASCDARAAAPLTKPLVHMPVTTTAAPAHIAVAPAPAVVVTPTHGDLGAFVAGFSHGQLKLISSTPGPDGMTAVNMQPVAGGQSIIGWVTPHEAGVVFGPYFDANGVNQNLTVEQTLNIKPSDQGAPAASQAGNQITPDQIKKIMASSGVSGFEEGGGPDKVSVFFDANCSACHFLWEQLQADHGWQKKFTITWIPVGAIKPTSSGLGAALLAGGAAALDYNENHFDMAGENGGIKPSDNQALLKKIQTNTRTMINLVDKTGQTPGTPTIVVNDEKLIVGVPSVEQMRAITGISFP